MTNRQIRLELEALEKRSLPSVTSASLVGNQIRIVGNNLDSNVSVSRVGNAFVVQDTTNGFRRQFGTTSVSSIRFWGGSGADHVENRAGGLRLVAQGMGGNDELIGSGANDDLDGGAGNDMLHGHGGADRLCGQGNSDSLYGGAGNDQLMGGAGNDGLFGGAGINQLWGGEGADRFLSWDRAIDKRIDVAHEDAVLRFIRGNKDWAGHEIVAVDAGLAYLHGQANDTAPLKLRPTHQEQLTGVRPVQTFVRVSAVGRDRLADNVSRGFIHVADLTFTSGASVAEAIIHEIGHNWDEETSTWNGWLGLNSAPVARDDQADTDEDRRVTIQVLANDSDADGDSLTPALLAGPEHGSVLLHADGSFTYSPDADYSGTDSFTYQLADGTQSNPATVSITVAAVNDAPMARNAMLDTKEDTSLALSAEFWASVARDVDGDAPSAVIVSGPSQGSVSDDLSLYLPNPGFSGMDSIRYRLVDVHGSVSGEATITITVTAVPHERIRATLSPDGVLTVRGTSKSDRIIVRFSRFELGMQVIDGSTGEEVTVGRAVFTQPSRPANGATLMVMPVPQVRRIIVSAGDGDDHVDVSQAFAPAEIHGGNGDDALRGGFGDDLLHGDEGNDSVFGFAGNDQLFGGSGHDRLFGEGDTDSLFGGDGNDWLEAGSSAEHADGGLGADWNAHAWALNGATMGDVRQYLSRTCWFLAALAAEAPKQDLAQRISYLGNFTYRVQLYNRETRAAQTIDVTFNGQTYDHDPRPAEEGEFWVHLFNRAARQAWGDENGPLAGGLTMVTGKSAAYYEWSYFTSSPRAVKYPWTVREDVQQFMRGALQAGQSVTVLTTWAHVLTVLSIDNDGQVTLRDPYGWTGAWPWEYFMNHTLGIARTW